MDIIQELNVDVIALQEIGSDGYFENLINQLEGWSGHKANSDAWDQNLAFLFNRRIYGRGFMRSLMILPIFATPFAIGFMFFTILFEISGPLAWMGIPFLSNHNWAPFSVMLVDIWQWTPFCFLVFFLLDIYICIL